MTFKQRYTAGCIFLTITITLQAQTLSKSIKDDRRKSLFESVKPPVNLRDPNMKRPGKTSVPVENNDHTEGLKPYTSGNGGAEFEDKYQVNKNTTTFTEEQLFKVSAGQEVKAMLIDGKMRLIPVKEYERILDKLSLRHKLEGVMLRMEVGGLNLSGYKKKKISKKAKKILQEVYGMKVEDE